MLGALTVLVQVWPLPHLRWPPAPRRAASVESSLHRNSDQSFVNPSPTALAIHEHCDGGDGDMCQHPQRHGAALHRRSKMPKARRHRWPSPWSRRHAPPRVPISSSCSLHFKLDVASLRKSGSIGKSEVDRALTFSINGCSSHFASQRRAVSPYSDRE